MESAASSFGAYYLWIKAIHVIAVISWMAGLLYLPRLFVYHATAERGSTQSETFKLMERRLAHAIMTPAMIVSFIAGFSMLAINPGLMAAGSFMHIKLLFVFALLGVHLMMLRWRREFEEDRNTRPQRFYRIVNEVPTLLMVGIVILIIVRPV